MVRHIAGGDNVAPDGTVINPELIRHGTIHGGRIAALAGPIDPLTHLNLDFSDHRVDACAVADELRVGSPVHWNGDGLRFVRVSPEAYKHLGTVAVAERRIHWLETFQERRQRKVDEG